MFIDMQAHTYAFPTPKPDGTTRFSTPEEVLREYDRRGIEKGVLMPLIGPEIYLPQSNEDILQVCERYPDRFIPFVNLDPRGVSNSLNADFLPWLNWYRERGCRGVGELMPNLPFTDLRVLNFFHQVEEVGLPLTFDISTTLNGHGNYGLYDDPGLPQLEFCLRLFPRLKIICHGPAFWSELGVLAPGARREEYQRTPIEGEGRVVELMRRYPNMYADLSAGSGYTAMTRDRKFAAGFLEEFQERLFYGTDICSTSGIWPLDEFLISLRDNGEISSGAFERIARGNAVKLLGL